MVVAVPTAEEFQALVQRVNALEQRSAEWDSHPDIDGCPDIGQPPPFIWHKNSGDNSEKVTNLSIINSTIPVRHVLYSVQLPTIRAGDLIEAFATFEVTNPYNVDIMCCRLITIGEMASATTGTDITEAAGRNVTPGMHHDTHQDFGTIVGDPDMSNKYVNLIAYANRKSFSGKLVVEPDYGRLFVKVTRKAALEN